jgi:hypothetical protein
MLRLCVGGGFVLLDVVITGWATSAYQAPGVMWGGLALTLMGAYPTVSAWAEELFTGGPSPAGE